jgi:hypothetical protein
VGRLSSIPAEDPAKLDECFRAGAAIRRLFDRSPQQVRDALRPFGYYDPRIESELTRLTSLSEAS